MKKITHVFFLFFLLYSMNVVAEQQQPVFVKSTAVPLEPELEQKIVVSRSVALSEKQRLEISYPGHGWVYIGEQTSQPGLRYEQRKLHDNASVFTFAAEKIGNYVLHFSYFDVFTDDFITDGIAVKVKPEKDTAHRPTIRQKLTVHAPEYKKTALDEEIPDAVLPDNDSAAAVNPVPDTVVSEVPSNATAKTDFTLASTVKSEETPEELSSDDLLKKAKTAIAGVDAAEALRNLEVVLNKAEAEKKDEALFLQGQAYELNGKLRNIRLALQAYQTLTAFFPQSPHWMAADKRIRYIKEYYINIR